MINNRQNGRRRGRGGGAPRPNGSGGAPDRGNRLDNRARGNAAQLHEKYKTLARDAQMQGDRVTTEYYLQFADHYFRVLSENRARFDEQQQQQRPRRDDYHPQGDYQGQGQGEYQDEFDDESESSGGDNAAQGGNGNFDERDGGDRQPRSERQERYERQDRPDRPDRFQRAERQDRPERTPRFEQRAREGAGEQPRQVRRGRPPRDAETGNGENRATADEARIPEFARPAEAQIAETPQVERPRRGRPRRTETAAPEVTQERIEIDRLPPAFGTDAPLLAGVVEPEAAAEKPRRRTTRKPRGDAVTADI